MSMKVMTTPSMTLSTAVGQDARHVGGAPVGDSHLLLDPRQRAHHLAHVALEVFIAELV